MICKNILKFTKFLEILSKIVHKELIYQNLKNITQIIPTIINLV